MFPLSIKNVVYVDHRDMKISAQYSIGHLAKRSVQTTFNQQQKFRSLRPVKNG